MEQLGDYLQRKCRELALIERCLPKATPASPPGEVDEIIARKFHAASALRAAQMHSRWQLTETHWAEESEPRIGPFAVTYNYQRADLAISGPPIYPALRQYPAHRLIWAGYTSCGMAAIAALAAAYGQICPSGAWILPSHGYPETRELVNLYSRQFGFVSVSTFPNGPTRRADGRTGRALFIDSGTATSPTLPALESMADADLILFDTTCLTASSNRIALVLQHAASAGVPVVLLRSHTKLDSLGVEYGRLGSIVIIVPETASAQRRRVAERVAESTNTARRLIGGAALPEHLPPFAIGEEWDALCRLRTARIIHNNRRAAQALVARNHAGERICLYRHGLFFTAAPQKRCDETVTRRMAASLVHHLQAAHLPLRRAGSFGFDFAVIDAYPDFKSSDFTLRIALSDLPDELIDRIIEEIETWTARQ